MYEGMTVVAVTSVYPKRYKRDFDGTYKDDNINIPSSLSTFRLVILLITFNIPSTCTREG
jgi:hypothetical protein